MDIAIIAIFSLLIGILVGALLNRESVSTATNNSIKNFSQMKSIISKNTKKMKPKVCDDEAMVIKERAD